MRFRRSQGDGTDTFQPRLWLILVGLIAMFLYLLAFISMNDDQINIDFVFFTATVSLIWAMVLMVGFGGLRGVQDGPRVRAARQVEPEEITALGAAPARTGPAQVLVERGQQFVPPGAEERADELDVPLKVAAAEELVHGRLRKQRRSDVRRGRRRLHRSREPLRQDEVADADARCDGLRERARESDVLPAVQLEQSRRRFALETDRPVRIVLEDEQVVLGR